MGMQHQQQDQALHDARVYQSKTGWRTKSYLGQINIGSLGILLYTLWAFLFLSVDALAATQSRVSAFDYDPVSGLLTKEIIEPDDPNLCQVTTYTYDSFGNKTSATTRNCNGSVGSVPGSNSEAAAPAATVPGEVPSQTIANPAIIETRTSSTAYDAQGRFATSSTNAIGQTETRTFNANFGTIATLTGPNGLTTNWTYDSFGKVLTESRADGTSTTTSYTQCTGTDNYCISNASYTITTTQAGAPTSVVTYNINSAVIQSATQDKDGNTIYARTEYDKLGRTTRSSRPFKANAATTWTSMTYDLLGRVTSTTAYDNTVSTVLYEGLKTTYTNAKSQARIEIKNTQGQLASVTDAYSKTLTYTYDPFGNLTKTTDALNNVTTISYDKRGRKIGMDDPDQGVWSYQYDTLGQLKRQRDAKNQVVTFAYDKLGRMTQRNEPDLISTWAYDTCDATLNPAGKCKGKVVQEASDNGYTRTYLYDAYGRITAEKDNVDTAYYVSKLYDSYGRVANIVYPNGLQITNSYSTSGHLNKVSNTQTGTAYWQAGSTDAEGRINQFTYGNNVTTTNTYDQMGRITQINAGSSNSVSNQSFVYDSIGNLTQRYDGASNLNEAFGYDNLNRLTSTSAQAGSGPLTQVTMTYNEIGNILSKSDVGTYTYASLKANGSARPHAVNKIIMNDGVTTYASYTYDANGNMLTSLDSSSKGRTVTWNSWNMPNSVVGNKVATSNPALLSSTPVGTGSSTFSVVYNSAHERIKETLSNWTVVYNISPRVDTGIHVEKRVKPDGTVQTVASLYAGGMPFGTVTTVQPASGSAATTYTRYFHGDHLGSIVAITDEAGTVTERRSYDAWGKRRNANGTPMTSAFVTPDERHGFTGHEEWDEVGLIHMNGRLYDPATGRFLSADPTIQYADDMQNYNRYSYINNNPLSAVDYSGHGFFKSVFKGIKNAFKGVGKLISSALKNNVIRMAGQIAAAVYGGPEGAALFAAASSYAQTGSLTKALTDGAKAWVTAEAFNLVGGKWDVKTQYWQNVAGHAAVGCGSALANGGSCGSGALAAGVAGAAAPSVSGWGPVGGTVASAVIGGTASVLGGGKFENGAMTGAFGYLFNCIPHECWKKYPELAPYKGIIEAGNIDWDANIAAASDMSPFKFIDAVKTNGPWDYKNNIRYPDANLLQEFGNFHFGAMAAETGFSLTVSLLGAGTYQTFKQNPSVTVGIKNGWNPVAVMFPNIVSATVTSAGYKWGDNPGDSTSIMRGWMSRRSVLGF
jgi:RHS repeat-associated protein